jgi:hypothetical protein
MIAFPNKEAYFDRKYASFFYARNALKSKGFSVSRHKAARPGVFSGAGFSCYW